MQVHRVCTSSPGRGFRIPPWVLTVHPLHVYLAVNVGIISWAAHYAVNSVSLHSVRRNDHAQPLSKQQCLTTRCCVLHRRR
jgi:hypothetical protein